MKFSRTWAMPNGDTFCIKPIREFVVRHMNGVSVDPFSRNSTLATYTNDINPNTAAREHVDARIFLELLSKKQVLANTIIFDPPYSPRQISECYNEVGIKTNMQTTQNARFYRECRNLFRKIAAEDCVVLSFGWNSTGMGKGWEIIEVLLVCHGGAHNDTICIAERKKQQTILLADALGYSDNA